MNTICQKLAFMLVVVMVACTPQVAPTPIPTATPVPEAVTLQLNWEHNANFLGFYVALGKGFYEQEGLDVTIRALGEASDATSIPEQVADGGIEYAIGSRNLLQAQSDGLPLTAISNIYKNGPGAFFARADSGIVTPADFAGRSVVVKGAAWQNVLEILLDSVNLTLDDVTPVEGSFDMTPFLEGEVDVWAGFVTEEATRARQAGLELVTFPLYEYGIRSNPVTLYITHEYLDNNNDQVERFVRASLQGWQWAIENQEEAIDIMLASNPELEDREFHIASFDASIPLIIPPGVSLGSIDCQAWVQNAVLVDMDSYEGLCTTEIFEQAMNES